MCGRDSPHHYWNDDVHVGSKQAVGTPPLQSPTMGGAIALLQIIPEQLKK